MTGDMEGMRRIEQSVIPDETGAVPGEGSFVVEVTPPGRRFWLNDDDMPRNRKNQIKPTFRISEVARFFFARSADWMRWLDGLADAESPYGVFTLDGKPLQAKRTDSGSRTYTLADIERMAHALLEHGRIDGRQFIATIALVKWQAYNYGVLKDVDMAPQATHAEVEGQISMDEALEEQERERQAQV